MRVPEAGKETRAWKRDLQYPVSSLTRIRELLSGQETLAAKLAHDSDRWPLDHHLPELFALPLAPKEGIEVPLAEPLDGGRHLALEGEAPHLPIGYDIEVGLFLKSQCFIDRPIFNPLELSRRELARGELFLRIEKLGWPKQAADDICVGCNHLQPPTRYLRLSRCWRRVCRLPDRRSRGPRPSVVGANGDRL